MMKPKIENIKKISRGKASSAKSPVASPTGKENRGVSTPVSLGPSTPTTPKNLVKTPEEEQARIITSLFTPIEEGCFLPDFPDDTGSSSTVFIVSPKKGPHRGTKKLPTPEAMAVKLQAIHRPKDLSDQAYRELLILESLTSLATKKQCFHFVTLNQWFKSWNNHIQHMNYVMGESRL